MRGYCNNPVICESCGSKRGFPKLRLCRSCQVNLNNPNSITPWTEGQRQLLREAYTASSSTEMRARRKRLAELTGYTRGQIDAECRRLGLRMMIQRPYTPREEQYLRDNCGEVPLWTIAKVLGRGVPCLRAKLTKMQLRYHFEAEGLTKQDFAEAMGVGVPVVRKWITLGHLRLFDGRISQTAAKEFVSENAHLYNLRRVDDYWFKSLIFGETRHAS